VRLPIRLRLTAWYALVLAAIVAAVGAFVVVRLNEGLESEVDHTLRAAAVQIGIGFHEDGPPGIADVANSVLSGPRSAAQLIAPGGRVLAAYGDPAARRPLIGRADLARVLHGAVLVRDNGPLRVVARAAAHRGQPGVVVAAQSLQGVRHTVDRVLLALLIAGPAALAATALGGWWLAGRALRPVDRMAARAARIGPDRLDERLAVPVARDELNRLATTLNGMLERIEHGVREQQRLVADASHELRTPLAAMRAELDVSLRADELGPAAREVLVSTREEVDRLSRTVDDLLTLAAADEGRLDVVAVPLDLADVARAAAGAAYVTFAGGPATALGDADRLSHAVRNLIENATKFGPPGGEVRVTTWTADGEAGVTVRDDGPGIPPDLAERVFDRFFRVDAARGRATGGSGLGLAIVRAVADAHGGRAWAEGNAVSLAIPAQTTSSSRGGEAPGRVQVSAATLHANSAASATAPTSESAPESRPRIRH
jgi:two-component system, OmpR family, sensor kinase